MRTNNVLTSVLFGILGSIGILATPASAVPILVTLEAGAGDLGPLSFSIDLQQQPRHPHDYQDINEFSGDYLFKQEDYRINVADYFLVEMDGWSGYGFNWLLERYPSGQGIYEEYCAVQMFKRPGETLVLTGAWSTSWSEDTPLYAFQDSPEGLKTGDYRIASMVETPVKTIPEASSLALFGSALMILAGFREYRNRGSRR